MTHGPATLGHTRNCELAPAELHRLAALATGADPATPVPTCGDWTLAALLVHTGEVVRWATAMVRDLTPARYPRESMDWAVPADPAALPDWIHEAADDAALVFAAADPDAPMWVWGWPRQAGFWPRRMVHEVGVHRADAELALGMVPAFVADVAADGVSELLGNLPHAAYFAPNVERLRGDGEVLVFTAADVPGGWRIELRPDGFTWRHGAGAGDLTGADATLAAPSATDLLLRLWGRPATTAVTGDAALVEHWLANSAL